jgi:UDP-3-O-[3-hydroxymyristoyl] glucosamine N-acyltransferase
MPATTAPYTTADLAERVHGELCGRSDLPITGINSLEDAAPDEITYIADVDHARLWPRASARAAVVSKDLLPTPQDLKSRALIVVPDAEMAVIELLRLFESPPPAPRVGIHPTAWVDDSVRMGTDVRIGPHVSVDERSIIGDRVVLHAGVRIYADVEIGDDCVVHANTVIRERCRLGRRVILHPNVSIGADGFGYQRAPGGDGLVKVPQIGSVILDDDVEIGAGSCVDRGKFHATIIGAGTKIDNLVQVAHNCCIGRSCVVAAMTAIAGSVTIGDGVRIGGCVGIADHVVIGSGASIAGKSGVMRDIPPGATHLGHPAYDARLTLRQWAAIHKLPDWMKQVTRQMHIEQPDCPKGP